MIISVEKLRKPEDWPQSWNTGDTSTLMLRNTNVDAEDCYKLSSDKFETKGL